MLPLYPRIQSAVFVGVTVAVLFTAPLAQAQGTKDIVDVAVAAGSFKTLVAAVQAADLVEVLKRPGPLPSSPPRTRPLPRSPRPISTR